MKVWASVIVFFGIGVSLGLAVALAIVEGGGSTLGAVAGGSFVGGFGAWFVPYVASAIFKRFRGRRHLPNA
jgi:hypothetical protein